jgi:hypothetical protein
MEKRKSRMQMQWRGTMNSSNITFGKLLQIIFRYLNESPKVLAEFYIDRDRTLVYKWLRHKGLPSKKLIPGIIRFVTEKSSESERQLISDEIRALVANSGLCDAIKSSILSITDFRRLLEEAISLSITGSNAMREGRSIRAGSDVSCGSDVPCELKHEAPADGSPFMDTGSARETAGGSNNGACIAEQDSAAVLPQISTDASLLAANSSVAAGTSSKYTVSAGNILYALLAALTGGLLWNLLNTVLGLRIYMGGSGPTGFLSFLWGITVSFPVILFALFSLKSGNIRQTARQPSKAGLYRTGMIPVYTIVGGLTGLLFYNSSIRTLIESGNLRYEIQESFIVLAFASVVSLPPYLAVLLVYRVPVQKRLLLPSFLFPVVLTGLAVASTFVVHAPVHEINQFRGFIAGFSLRLSMYIVLRLILAEALLKRVDSPSPVENGTIPAI